MKKLIELIPITDNTLINVTKGITTNFNNINLFNSNEIRVTIVKYITNLLSQFQVMEEEKDESYAYHYNHRFTNNKGFLFDYTNAYFKKVETLIISFFKSIDDTALITIIGEKFGDEVREHIYKTLTETGLEKIDKSEDQTDKFDSNVTNEQDETINTTNAKNKSGNDSTSIIENVTGNIGTQFEDSPVNGSSTVDIFNASEKSKSNNSSDTTSTNTVIYNSSISTVDDLERNNDVSIVKDETLVKTKTNKDSKTIKNDDIETSDNTKDLNIFQYKIDAYIEMMKKNPISEIFDPYINSIVYELNAIF